MKRRTFLKKTAAGAAALMAAPAIRASDKAGTKNPIIGTGDHRYECIHGWGQLPRNGQWQTTHGVTIDEAGFVYIKQQGYGQPPKDTIYVFDRDGKFVRSFGKEYHGGGHGIDIRKEGNDEFLYITNTWRRTFAKTTLRGEVVWLQSFPWKAKLYQEVEKYSPTNIAFHPEGGFYVADGYGSNYIHEYDKDAQWVRSWGGGGIEPGKMNTPHGIWLDDRPGREKSLVVADRANARLQYFSLDGKHLGFVNDLLFPAHFDIRGEVLLVPDLHARVSLFDKDNKPIVHLGDDHERIRANTKFTIRNDPKQWVPGKFVHPHDACFDKEGNIFVVEWVQTGRVTFLRHV